MAHWYNTDGSTCYTLIGANGKEREPTLRDARKLNLATGATSILKVKSAEGLTKYRINDAVQETIAAITNNPFCEMGQSRKDWEKKIKEIAREKSKETLDASSKRGTQVHDILEKYYIDKQLPDNTIDKEIVIDATQKILETFGDIVWKPEHSFNYLGLYGGKVDLHSNHGQGIVVDYKTKDDIKKMKGYESHRMQLAAYRKGLGLPTAICANVFSLVETNLREGEVFTPHTVIEIYTEEEIQEAWEMFKCLCVYWHIDNKVNQSVFKLTEGV